MSWQETYSRQGDPFGAFGPERTNPEVCAVTVSSHHDVVAEHGRIAGEGDDSSLIGRGWAHTIANSRLNVGDRTSAGTTVAQCAGPDDRPGSAWFGVHIHTTLSPLVTGIYEGEVHDPAPRIRAAASSTTASASIDSTPLEDPDMARRLNLRETKDGTNNTPTLFFDGGPGVGIKPIQNPAHAILLNRYLDDKPGDHMYPGEIAIINSYLRP